MCMGKPPSALNLNRHCCLLKTKQNSEGPGSLQSWLLEDCRDWTWCNPACWSHAKLYLRLPKLGYLAAFHEWFRYHMNLWWCRQQLPYLHRTPEEWELALVYLVLLGGIVLVENHCSKDDWWTDTIATCFEQTDTPALSHHVQELAKLLVKACCCEFSKALGEEVEIRTAQGVQGAFEWGGTKKAQATQQGGVVAFQMRTGKTI